MNYMDQARFDALEKAYLDPPEPDDHVDYDDHWGEQADIQYDQMREEKLCHLVLHNKITPCL